MLHIAAEMYRTRRRVGGRRSGAGLALACLAGLLMGPNGNPRAHARLVLGQQSAHERWILAFAGDSGRVTYSVDDFVRLIAEVDTTGTAMKRLCTGVVFLALRTSAGRHFSSLSGPPYAQGKDWEAYVDGLFALGGPVARLDSAVAIVDASVGAIGQPMAVAFMIPYPEPKLDTLRLYGQTYEVGVPDGRVAAAERFAREVANRFQSARFRRLVHNSFYWLYESVHGQDEQIVPRVGDRLHAMSFRFLWIPFFTAWGVDDWRRWGFDEAWLQPNYFFDPRVPQVRLDSAAVRARSRAMGLEIEFDGRVYTQPGFYDRLGPYLSILESSLDIRRGSIAIYEGGGALIELSRRKAFRYRALYKRLVDALDWNDSTFKSTHN